MTLAPVTLQWAEFAPDMSDYSPEFTDAVRNVVPAPDGYVSFPSHVTSGTGLGDACRGAITVRKADGSSAIYAGTSTRLYRYDSGALAWDNVTRSSGGDYAVPTDNDWSFVQFGTRLIACNGSDATQYIDVDAGSNFAALTGAPIGKFAGVAGDFLVLANLSTNKRALAWSGLNDSEYWTYGKRGSDDQTLPDGGDITGIVGMESGAVIFQKDKIRAMTRVASNDVFNFKTLHEHIGCYAPYSIAAFRNSFFWFDQGGFYEGIEAKPIGANKVNRYALSESDPTYRATMRGAYDPVTRVVWWSIRDSANTAFLLGYAWETGRWTRVDANTDYIFAAIPPGYTYDGAGAAGFTYDTAAYAYDSSFWTGSQLLSLAGFETDGDFGYFSGSPMAAVLETHDTAFSEGGHSFVNSARAIGDAAASNITVQIGTRHVHGDALTWSAATAMNTSTGRAFIRKRGVTHRARVNIASSAWTNANGVILYARQAGMR